MAGQRQTSGPRRRPSENEDSFIDPLQELDPSPLDWTPDLEQGEYSPSTSSAGAKPSETPSYEGESEHRHAPIRHVGLSGKGWEYWLSTLQRTSTYPPTLFLTLHLTNTSLIPLLTNSIPASEPYLLLTRPFYQSPALEPLILTLPILTHLASGVALRILRARRRARLYGAETRAQRHEFRASGNWRRPSVQARLGYLLLPLLASHVLANRVVPAVVDGGSSGVGLGFVAHGIARAPWVMRGWYAALVGVGVWHVVGGWAWWMGYRQEITEAGKGKGKGQSTGSNGGFLGSLEWRKRSRRVRWVVIGVSVAGAGLWLAGGLGVLGRGGLGMGWEAKGWDKIYREVPLLGWVMGLK
ncbi:tRNA (guanine26-N2/guanine27-N2)-dimethyltransferase [Blastomyces parvus]|uniref:tRNA (Guanine26-N2/guanine27-N2)-dimethyltransferase n=1 Tax=Blastomyces parvus TaxID=2060905 RepID=A0A2B7WL79_9EURO|nr:tRNA (guanine26-N2/guanine27-N2)-dimethyltransferase [Blastomyces parvus]